MPEQRARDTSTIQPSIRGLPRKRPIDLTKEPETNDTFLTGARETFPISPIKTVILRGLALQPEGVTFKIGMDIELDDDSFLRIEKIIKKDHRYLFSGRRLFRPKAFNGVNLPKIIPDARNELIWVPQRTSLVLATKVVGISEIVFTNERGKWRDSRTRTCRLKVSYKYRGDHYENPVKNANWVVRDISLRESDPGKGFTSQQLRERWRGHTTPFGEGKAPAIIEIIEQERPQSPEIIDLDNLMPTPPATPPTIIDLTADETNAYTFGDAFCGGGGASCGARQAGLQLKWAFDSNQDAIMTYRLNFGPNVRSLCMEAFRFFSNPDRSLRVDIMHASPPCQTFSPAHTVHNQERDDKNSACIHGIGHAVKEVRPRVVTMEETFGLEHEAHRPSLFRLVMDLVELGYSVRWQVIKLSDYGVPQIRKRLILIAVG